MTAFFAVLDPWLRSKSGQLALSCVRAFVILLVGYLLAKAARRLVKGFGQRLTPQHRMLLSRSLAYSVGVLSMVSALREIGFDLSVLLGAAGILTVAVGFASQTSMSNVISGLFLIGERPFVLGDIVRIGATTGEVVEIGLVSVHIRTFQNTRVRIPNEQIFKSEITNLSQYPIRRIDISFRVARGQDLAAFQVALLEAVSDLALVLEEPKASLLIQGLSTAGVEFLLMVWTARDNLTAVQNAAHEALDKVLTAYGTTLPETDAILRAVAVGDITMGPKES